MNVWQRHLPTGDSRFHAIASVVFGGSTQTRCGGRWPEKDAVEESEAPPADERCRACVRAMAQLETHERFDVGGEA